MLAAPTLCRAIEHAFGVEDQAAVGTRAVGPLECVEHPVCPVGSLHCRGLQPEHNSISALQILTLRVPATVRCAIQRAVLIQHQTAVWIGSVFLVLEAVQNLLRPLPALLLRRTQFKDRPAKGIKAIARAEASTELRRSIQIPRVVEYQIPLRKIPVLASLEAVDHGLGPDATCVRRWRHFIDQPTAYVAAQQNAVPCASVSCRTIRISALVENHSAGWDGAVAAMER